MKLFLTGGTGFIGQPLTRSLLARGWHVVALVRTPDSPQARALTKLGVQCVKGDVTDRHALAAAMPGADMVIHNAGWYEIGVHPGARKRMHAINVAATENLLEAARELGIARTVYVSSVVAYGDSGPQARDETYVRQAPYSTYYEQTKTQAHAIAQQFQQDGLPLIIVCPAHVCGPNDHALLGYFLRLYLNRLMVPFAFSPEMQVCPVHVDDIGAGIALAAQKGRPGESYILAGDAMRLREIFDIWHTKPGRFKVRFYIPRWLAIPLFAPLAPLLRLVGLPAFISRETVLGSSISYNFSSAKAQRELGWRYRPAQELWLSILDQELDLLAQRTRRDLVSRLNPLVIEP